eukprot:CAMPEP_0175708336 /NCGR_PEP_ID=MMETSP0097-20121207/39017_1 /TAXON_ID=311494 /ORGANISM="Alexandrium monilatum, Strain CCMP3105" /LENGTH=268 /DNA_ID=CAMNT_0017015727 /DNA_START=108 /DNA_END=910 /DNA_ORIENTATION=-
MTVSCRQPARSATSWLLLLLLLGRRVHGSDELRRDLVLEVAIGVPDSEGAVRVDPCDAAPEPAGSATPPALHGGAHSQHDAPHAGLLALLRIPRRLLRMPLPQRREVPPLLVLLPRRRYQGRRLVVGRLGVLHQVSKLLDQLLKKRPVCRVLGDTPESNLCQGLCQRQREVAGRVEHLYDLGNASLEVVDQVAELVGLVGALYRWRCTRQQLQQDHAETVDLAALCDDARADVLGACIPDGATRLLHLVLRSAGDAREAEVRHLGSAV